MKEPAVNSDTKTGRKPIASWIRRIVRENEQDIRESWPDWLLEAYGRKPRRKASRE